MIIIIIERLERHSCSSKRLIPKLWDENDLTLIPHLKLFQLFSNGTTLWLNMCLRDDSGIGLQ